MLRIINERMRSLESNFENSFLLASSETLKKLVDYKQLMDAVLSVNKEKEARKSYMTRYQQIMDSINLLTEVSRIIYQIFMALKQTSKIMSETTYTWKQFASICEKIIVNVINKTKIKKAGRASSLSAHSASDEISGQRHSSALELEIDQEFFSSRVVP